ncbi:TetR/AcrR family transcriptional regulator [Streptomyces sp. NBC_00059]|uniref:TetR/AcrR family transcriptional regulator n=1 Tax=Streptomyces sp. NBC_00059 TaxID=2975635 RepID=UPI002250E5C8|nr:TetR/AcrR family transcriptional regulator [Streptomyces sp. NBC_00059]MCX5414369.1 TetR/AcrR family transcriptional regulator [Streptomyces sp. NBC_00059]
MTTGPGEGLRERKKRATRKALQSSAVALFRERGPEAVTVEDICADAGVSPRTFFNYFSTKEEAVFVLEEGAPELIRRRITERPSHETPLEAVHAVLAERLGELTTGGILLGRAALLRERPELLPRIAQTNRAVEDAVVAAVAARTGLPDTDLYVRTTAAVAFAAQQAAVACWRPDSGDDAVTVLERAVGLVRDGLAQRRPQGH